MLNILIIFGTRPEVIKLCPLINVLRKHQDKYKVFLCNTEQQRELSAQMLSFWNINPDFSLNVMTKNQNLCSAQVKIMDKLSCCGVDFDAIIVQGDTLSAFCGALWGYYNHIPVFHLEAGLRTHDLQQPFPEEALRQMIARIATLHFAPTKTAKQNLLREGIAAKKIYITGNTVIDAAKSVLQKQISLTDVPLKPQKKNILVTIHRRENHRHLSSIIHGISLIAEKYTDINIIIPIHPNPNVKDIVINNLQKYGNVHIIPPLNYIDVLHLLKNCCLVLTDSGGIQEEACYLGCQLLILREKTERTEIVENKVGQLVGVEGQKIFICASKKIDDSSRNTLNKKYLYGKGHAADKIEKIIAQYFTGLPAESGLQ